MANAHISCSYVPCAQERVHAAWVVTQSGSPTCRRGITEGHTPRAIDSMRCSTVTIFRGARWPMPPCAARQLLSYRLQPHLGRLVLVLILVLAAAARNCAEAAARPLLRDQPSLHQRSDWISALRSPSPAHTIDRSRAPAKYTAVLRTANLLQHTRTPAQEPRPGRSRQLSERSLSEPPMGSGRRDDGLVRVAGATARGRPRTVTCALFQLFP